MKYLFGGIITTLILITVFYYTLTMWGVHLPIDDSGLVKILVTGGIILLTIVLLKLIRPFFFGDQGKKRYEAEKGNPAKPNKY